MMRVLPQPPCPAFLPGWAMVRSGLIHLLAGLLLLGAGGGCLAAPFNPFPEQEEEAKDAAERELALGTHSLAERAVGQPRHGRRHALLPRSCLAAPTARHQLRLSRAAQNPGLIGAGVRARC